MIPPAEKQGHGEKIAKNIINAREGKMKVESGGGGMYGKVSAE